MNAVQWCSSSIKYFDKVQPELVALSEDPEMNLSVDRIKKNLEMPWSGETIALSWNLSSICLELRWLDPVSCLNWRLPVGSESLLR